MQGRARFPFASRKKLLVAWRRFSAPAPAAIKSRAEIDERRRTGMTTGRFVTDLDRGDVMGPVDYVMSRFVVREYCHAVEMHQPCFQGIDAQIAPPTLVHLD